MEMEDQYGLADLRQYMNGRSHFPAIPPPAELFPGHHHRSLTPAPAHHLQHYEMVMLGHPHGHGIHHDFIRSDSTNSASVSVSINTGNSTPPSLSGLEMEAGGGIGGGGGGGDAGTGRWPRQETLTLLEIRSRLDSKFKEANQKGPLWDEVSRIMSEEHGYQRTGKKCREKFENLYKYYKKTKEGKAGRQDGKHYRFFRQLEALYGESSNQNSGPETHLVGSSFRYNGPSSSSAKQPNQDAFHVPKLSDSLSLSNSSAFDTSSSDDSDLNETVAMGNDSIEMKKKKKRGGRNWKAKIKDFIDGQMRKIIEKQEAWLQKMMRTIEEKEQERMLKEEEWRKQEEARIEREQKFWANEKAWIEARDAAMMDALQKLTGKDLKAAACVQEELMVAANLRSLNNNQHDNGIDTIDNPMKGDSWPECEITKLIQLRTNMESRFQQGGCSEDVFWEEIAAKMACLGYDRTALMCKEKWDCITNYLLKFKEGSKKRKENSRGCSYYHANQSICIQGGSYCDDTNEHGAGEESTRIAPNNHVASPPNSNTGNSVSDGCFRFFVNEGENVWENYDVSARERPIK